MQERRGFLEKGGRLKLREISNRREDDLFNAYIYKRIYKYKYIYFYICMYICREAEREDKHPHGDCSPRDMAHILVLLFKPFV